MRDVLKDEKLKKLLKDKQRLEMFSWIIPLISIFSLIIILFLTSKTNLTEFTIIILVLLIFLIIGGYIFDNKITIKIHQSYSQLNEYFQNEIVPKLLVKDNPSIKYDKNKMIDSELIDDLQLFNNFTDYKSYFNYNGQLENHDFTFSEVMFSNLVEYDTSGNKILNNNIENKINYHWYTFKLNKEYPVEALYLISKFDSYDGRLIKNFHRFDFMNCRVSLNSDLELNLYLKDLNEYRNYTTEKILKTLNDDMIVYNSIFAIYIKNNEIHIIIEEIEDLINLTHSNHIVLESLLKGYNDEQRLIKLLLKAFD
ncbi:hypothetical protein KHQ81_11110 [Mycoplasmatota bacterium]|nr:hypothetical protein KHQ81_11110 [Mycoplasmatota bacterium]